MNDPFEHFKTADEIMAYLYRQHGEDTLVEVLAALLVKDKDKDIDRGFLQRAADAMAAAGLKNAADIVMEGADEAALEGNPRSNDPAEVRDYNRRTYGDFSGFFMDDEQRQQRLRLLRGQRFHGRTAGMAVLASPALRTS
jgi:hypothetical protein